MTAKQLAKYLEKNGLSVELQGECKLRVLYAGDEVCTVAVTTEETLRSLFDEEHEFLYAVKTPGVRLLEVYGKPSEVLEEVECYVSDYLLGLDSGDEAS